MRWWRWSGTLPTVVAVMVGTMVAPVLAACGGADATTTTVTTTTTTTSTVPVEGVPVDALDDGEPSGIEAVPVPLGAELLHAGELNESYAIAADRSAVVAFYLERLPIGEPYGDRAWCESLAADGLDQWMWFGKTEKLVVGVSDITEGEGEVRIVIALDELQTCD